MGKSEEKEPIKEITLGDLLQDAATELKSSGLPSLARAVLMAEAQLETSEIGEAWIADIMQALDESDRVIETARTGNGEVNLTRLAACLEVTRSWGLTPQARMGNALAHFSRLLSMIAIALDHEGEGEISIGNMRPQIEEAIQALGLGEDAANAYE